MSFITPTELKAYPLPVTAAQWAKITDAQIQVVLDYATTHITDWIDRDLGSAYYTERVVGTNRYTLLLENYPVTALIALSSRDYQENVISYASTDFLIHGGSGIIEWIDKTRYAFHKNNVWVVQYQAGYATIPGPVKHAVALQTVEMLQPIFRGGTDWNNVELISNLNEQIVDLCEKYKRKRIG